MSTEIYTLPDGKYIMDTDLWNTTKQGCIKKLFGSQVRVNIGGGSLKEFNVCTSNWWYRDSPEGRERSAGHMFIDTEGDLRALCNALPFSWRE